MTQEQTIGATKVRLEKADLTELDVEAFVHYAQHDLQLGSGYGAAISSRGGPSIQEECDALVEERGKLATSDVVATAAGRLKAKQIIHAVGPRFMEPEIEPKLRETVLATLDLATKQGITQLAMAPMGTGFYGIPLDTSARVMFEAIAKHCNNGTSLEEVRVVVCDKRDYIPFQKQMATLA